MPKLLDQIKWVRRSSTLRLSLLLSLIFALGMTVAIFVALTLGRDALERRVDTTLSALAGAAVLEEARGDSAAMIMRAPDDLRGLPRPFERAVARGGGTINLEHDFLRSELWRIIVTKDSRGTPIMLALPIEESEQAQELLAGILWTTAALVIAGTLAIGLGAGILAQRRLSRINATLGQLAAGDLGARTGLERAKDDLDDIARNLDNTAIALERLVTQTRNLSASLAHDLRTPLARLRAQLEMLPDGEARGAALEEAGRLSAIFDTIMRVARIEAGQGQVGFETVPLAALASEIAEIFGPVVEDAGKQLAIEVDEAGSVFADRQMLIQAMANLIQNALVHGGGQITLIAQGNRLGVSDNGAGVDPTEFDEILKPMVRLEASRTTEGAGLGLALVRAVADRHAARLELMQNKPQGLRVILNFAKM